MAQFVMTIPDAFVPALLDAFEWRFPIPIDPATGQPAKTQAENAKDEVRRFAREVYKDYKAQEAAQAAEVAAGDAADTESGGIVVS